MNRIDTLCGKKSEVIQLKILYLPNTSGDVHINLTYLYILYETTTHNGFAPSSTCFINRINSHLTISNLAFWYTCVNLNSPSKLRAFLLLVSIWGQYHEFFSALSSVVRDTRSRHLSRCIFYLYLPPLTVARFRD